MIYLLINLKFNYIISNILKLKYFLLMIPNLEIY